jgi:hypothetical protein
MTQTLRSIFEYIDVKKDYSDIDFSGFNIDLQGGEANIKFLMKLSEPATLP